MKNKLGILHPGEMGISVAVSAKNTGNLVYWASDGRSPQTRERAEEHDLIDLGTVDALCETCDVLICVCPPHGAEEVAGEVLDAGFSGLYVDANAVSPQRAIRIGEMMAEAGVDFVDGGIIGGPAWKPDSTWLYLSGEQSEGAASYFSAGPLGTEVIGDEIGKASAVKMCFAAYTKGSMALLCTILATAEALGVRENLEHQWSRGGSDFAQQTQLRAQKVTAKAWRFAGEMEEIAATFEHAGLPGGFHKSAAEIYGRISGFKGWAEPPSLEEVLRELLIS